MTFYLISHEESICVCIRVRTYRSWDSIQKIQKCKYVCLRTYNQVAKLTAVRSVKQERQFFLYYLRKYVRTYLRYVMRGHRDPIRKPSTVRRKKDRLVLCLVATEILVTFKLENFQIVYQSSVTLITLHQTTVIIQSNISKAHPHSTNLTIFDIIYSRQTSFTNISSVYLST